MNVIDSFRRGAGVALLVVLAASCAPASPNDATPASEEVLAQADPGATTFASVRANGTGCPPGTSSTAISRDGAVFTTTFASYVAQVDTSADVSVRDCQLEIALHTPEGRSYSVQSFSYSGFALLQQGVIGRQTANYYFQGNPVLPVESNRTELVGPHEKPYLFKDDVRIEDRVWSPCGLERNLNVVTRVQLFNTSPRRSGYMNLTSVDGSSKLELVLASRPCQAGNPTPSAALVKVAPVTVTPSAIERDQPFAVRWTPPAQNVDATYTVQLRTSEALGDALVWESASTRTGSVVYDGAPLETAGTYQIVVIARRGEEEARSDRINLMVREIVGTEPQLGKPTAVRVSPSPIARDQPFVVTWTPSSNASSGATYRVEVHTPASAGFQLVARAPETPAPIAALPANVLPRDGSYQVVVIARDAGRDVSSDPLTVSAVATTIATPVTPPGKDDATPTQPPAATADATRMIGRYAARYISFARGSSDASMRTKELGLAEISQGPSGLELRYSLCSQDSRSLGFTFLLSRPEAYPTTVRTLRVEGERWFTEGEPFGTGYDREGVAACRGRAGQTIARQSAQRWLTGGTCRCPSSAQTIPTADDCRVTDPDGDGKPGLAYRWFGPGGSFEYTSHAATVQRTQLRDGVIAADGRHVAGARSDESVYPLQCEGLLCKTATSVGVGEQYRPCVSRYNRFELTPLPDPPSGNPRWTCVDLNAAEARLFPRPVIATPTRCETQSLTDPQP